jgi:hypothetical protein
MSITQLHAEVESFVNSYSALGANSYPGQLPESMQLFTERKARSSSAELGSSPGEYRRDTFREVGGVQQLALPCRFPFERLVEQRQG